MEFEIKGVNYRTAKLDVFQQLKVSRKPGLVSEFSTLKAQAAAGNSGAVLESVLPKIADTLAALPDEDVNAVIYPCLSVVSRQHEKGWTKVFDQGVL
ncbi:phage tail assembly chaperone, partial [Klebsiella pneumoniae]|uniref:phage tail assembly chaperone n=1 Tax=Klebsiella pneumoniae TaxID=573 RepID=UPI000A1725D3